MNLLLGDVLSGHCAVLFSKPVMDVRPSLSSKNKGGNSVAWLIVFNMKEGFVMKWHSEYLLRGTYLLSIYYVLSSVLRTIDFASLNCFPHSGEEPGT